MDELLLRRFIDGLVEYPELTRLISKCLAFSPDPILSLHYITLYYKLLSQPANL